MIGQVQKPMEEILGMLDGKEKLVRFYLHLVGSPICEILLPWKRGSAIGLLFWLLVAFLSFVIIDSAPILSPWKQLLQIGIPFVIFYALFSFPSK